VFEFGLIMAVYQVYVEWTCSVQGPCLYSQNLWTHLRPFRNLKRHVQKVNLKVLLC